MTNSSLADIARAIRVFSIVALCASQLTAQDPFAGNPIPNGPDVKTNGEYREGFYRYYLQLVDHYKQHTKDTAAAQEAGIKLLTSVARTRCLESPERSFDELHTLSKEAFDAGTTDLLILQRYARLRAVSNDFEVARKTLLDCEARLEESGYPRIVAMLNSFYLCSLARMTSDEDFMDAHFPTFLDRFSDWVEEESKTKEHRRYVVDLAYSMTGDFLLPEQKEAILNSLDRRDEVDGWVADVLAGAVHIDIGWFYRGGTWASDVSGRGWRRLSENLEVSTQRLRRAWKAQPDYPEAPALMITVSKAGAEAESPRVWFDRAVAAEMDYPMAYRRLSDAMLPRWGGSHQALSRFGLECLGTKRFDTLVPLELYNQVWTVENETGRSDRYLKSPKVYTKLREMFDGYRNAPAAPQLHDLHTPRKWILSSYAAVALVAEQWEDAIVAIESVDGELDPQAMKNLTVGSFHVSQAYASTGDVKDLVFDAAQLAKSNTKETLEQAIAKLNTAADKNTDERAEVYLTSRPRLLSELLDFQEGGWAALTFDESLSGWNATSGVWERESDTAVIGSLGRSSNPSYYRPLTIQSRNQFQPPYQLEVDIEEVRGGTVTGVGVTIGDVSLDGAQASDGRFCFAHMHAVGIDDGTQEGRRTQMDNPAGMNWTEPKYHLDVRVWPGSLMFLVNNSGPRGTVLGGGFDPGLQIGFAGRYEHEARVRFSNVRIRKLPYDSLLTIVAHPKLITESTKMIEFDPEDWFARWVRGSSHFTLRRYDEAIADFSALERIDPENQGASYMLAAAYAKVGKHSEAMDKVKAAYDANPLDHRVLRLWAELEIRAENPQQSVLEGALKRAREAYRMASRNADAWQYQITVAEAHAELGDLTEAVEELESVGMVMDPVGNGELQQMLFELRNRKRNSYKSAIASLLWEGDMTTRILGLVLAVILLAANLIVIRKVAKLGRRHGAAAGLVGVAISIGIPCVLAVYFGIGEGPAFTRLLAAIVGVAAIIGAIGGFCSAGAKEPATTDAADLEPIVAEVTDGQQDEG